MSIKAKLSWPLLLASVGLSLLQLFFHLGKQADWQLIILQLRLPRLLFEIGTGLGLGISALLLAATLRQPYIDGSMLGIASGSQLLTALAAIAFPQTTSYRVLIGAVAAVFCLLLLRISVFKFQSRPLFMIIGGFCWAMFFEAVTSILTETSGWSGKSLANTTWIDVSWLALFLLLGWLIWQFCGRFLPFFALPKLQTSQLGIDEAKVSLQLQLLACLWLGALTAVLGTAFFVGVVLNQLVKELTQLGLLQRLSLVALFSVFSLLLADTLAHFTFYPIELPTNTVLLILSAPAFVFLLVRWSHAI